MSPPTPVRTRAEMHSIYKEQLTNPGKYQCTLKSLSQLECTFKISPTNSVLETICIPFKRVFQRCLQPYTRVVDGKKQRGERWINIEVTDLETNDGIRSKHTDEIQRFLKAEVDLAKWLESQMEEES
ncbi:hypothetical protein METBIDRAFT_47459 [Metschnikowia bicuspidata var. bicuspidata NRRL YB-4993]|uniref:Uncharacterized protein n=1 Tax=Metschnikowia bicuspidata var. bicuspidata NRRL YB-4993 TaxID=869754 RepID=A0A1A0H4E3_9ASCO|nr:hypothetical protein METBIDRAFT_47459 [Metschnikowia bicuspidata var. bicuspidata NRRL YB-4993]OBA18944.1 hypothetical protein METBIDRAFT_47459 [Metschnikowia bicuspidata var. bicuspidata NRRL YB-4993]